MLQYLTHLLPNHPDIFRYVFTGLDQDSEQAYYKQLIGLCHLSRYLEKAVCFIGIQSPVSQHHFVFGVIVNESLLLINPVGISQHKDLKRLLKTVKRLGQLKTIYQSCHRLQQDPQGLVSCGPIVVECMRHISQLPFRKLLQRIEQWNQDPSEEDLIVSKDIDDLLPASLIPLLKPLPQDDYQQHILGLRQQHLEILKEANLQTDEAWDALTTVLEQQILFELPPVKLDSVYALNKTSLQQNKMFKPLLAKREYLALLKAKLLNDEESQEIITAFAQLLKDTPLLKECLDFKGYTSVLLAILYRHTTMAQLLIEQGASLDRGLQRRYQGALECAKEQNNPRLVALLEEKIKNQRSFLPQSSLSQQEITFPSKESPEKEIKVSKIQKAEPVENAQVAAKKNLDSIVSKETSLLALKKSSTEEDASQKIIPAKQPLVSGEKPTQFFMGESDFYSLIKGNYRFIDKSLFIKKLIAVSGSNKVYLILRPRRFGKTLMMSMLEHFLSLTCKKSQALFTHLNIFQDQDFCQKHMHCYPVISLSFKSIKPKNLGDFQEELRHLMAGIYQRFDSVLRDTFNEWEVEHYQKICKRQSDIKELRESLKKLTEYLFKYYDRKVFILIDEYDTPIHSSYDHDCYQEVVEYMAGFLGAALKDNSYLERGILTGILQVAKAGMFSDLNNIAVYTMLSDTDFSEYFGFTKQEVQTILQDFSFNHQFATKEILQRLSYHYGGYQIGDELIHNPWSLMNVINQLQKNVELSQALESGNYWIDTGSMATVGASTAENSHFIANLLEKPSVAIQQDFRALILGEKLEKRIDKRLVLSDLAVDLENIWSLLFLSGYLTRAREQQPVKKIKSTILTLPNAELFEFFKEKVIKWFPDEQKISQAHFISQLQLVQPAAVKKRYLKHPESAGLDTADKLWRLNTPADQGDAIEIWLRLLSSADVSTRQQAKQRLQDYDKFITEVVKTTYIKHLTHDDPLIRVEALEALLVVTSDLTTDLELSDEILRTCQNLLGKGDFNLTERLTVIISQLPPSLQQILRQAEKGQPLTQQAYLNRLIAENNSLEILGMGAGKIRIPLKKIYITLKLDNRNSYERQRLLDWHQQFFVLQFSSGEFLPEALKVKLQTWYHKQPGQSCKRFFLTQDLFYRALASKDFTKAEVIELKQSAQQHFEQFDHKHQLYESSNVEDTKAQTIAEVYEQSHHLIILGDPGSGKTSLMRWLTLKMAQALLQGYDRLALKPTEIDSGRTEETPLYVGKQVRLPILIRGTDYSRYYLDNKKNHALPSFITEIGATSDAEKQLLLAALAQGNALIMIDGLDEISDKQAREALAEDIQQFIGKSSIPHPDDKGNRVIMTSGEYVSGFDAQLRRFTIEGMTSEAIQQFYQAWFKAVADSLPPSSLVESLGSQRLVQQLKQKPLLWDMSRISQLANVIAILYYSLGHLPQTRAELYQKLIAHLIETWTHKKKTNLKDEQIFRLLTLIADEMHHHTSSITERKLQRLLHRSSQPEQTESFLQLLRHDVGLLVAFGQTDSKEYVYRFLYRTFQEYLAGYYLIKDYLAGEEPPQTLALRMIERLTNPLWREPLFLAMEILSLENAVKLYELIQALLNDGEQALERLQKPLNETSVEFSLTMLSTKLPFVVFFIVDAIVELGYRQEDLNQIHVLVQTLVLQLLLAYDRSASQSVGEQLQPQIEAKLWLLYQDERYQLSVKEALRKLILSKDNPINLAPAIAAFLRQTRLFLPELLQTLQQVLDRDEAKWEWSIQQILMMAVASNPAILPQPPELSGVPKGELLCQLLATLFHTSDTKSHAVVEKNIKQFVASNSIERQKQLNYIQAYITYQEILRSLTGLLKVAEARLPFKVALLQNPKLWQKVNQESRWQRLVVALYGGHQDYGMAATVPNYYRAEGFLRFSEKQQQLFKVDFVQRAMQLNRAAPHQTSFLDRGINIYQPLTHLISHLSIENLHKDSPLTDVLLKHLQGVSNFTELTKELWVISQNPREPSPMRCEAAMALLASGLSTTDFNRWLMQIQQSSFVSEIRQSLAQLEARLRGAVCQSVAQIWQDYERLRSYKNLSSRERLGLTRALLRIAMHSETLPILTKFTKHSVLYIAEISEIFAYKMTTEMPAQDIAIHDFQLPSAIWVQTWLRLGQCEQLFHPIATHNWCLTQLPPFKIPHNDLPIALLNNLEIFPHPTSFMQAIIFNGMFAQTLKLNPELLPEVLIAFWVGRRQTRYLEQTFAQLCPEFLHQTELSSFEFLKLHSEKLILAYYQARALSRLAPYAPMIEEKDALLEHAFVCALAVKAAYLREQVLEQILRVQLTQLPGPIKKDCLPVFQQAYYAARKIGDPAERARAFGRLVFSWIPEEKQSDFSRILREFLVPGVISRVALLKQALATLSLIKKENQRLETWRLLAPQLLVYPELDKDIQIFLKKFTDPLCWMLAQNQYGTLLANWTAQQKDLPDYWAPLILAGLVHQAQEALGEFLGQEVKLWRKLLEDMKNEEAFKAHCYTLERLAVEKRLHFTRAAALVCDQIFAQSDEVKIKTLIIQVLSSMSRTDQEVLPLLGYWSKTKTGLIRQWSTLLLAELFPLQVHQIDDILALLESPWDLLRHRAAQVIHHPAIVPDEPTRLLSVLGAETLKVLQEKALNHHNPAIGLQIERLYCDLIVDEINAVTEWVHQYETAQKNQDISQQKLYRRLLSHMEAVSSSVWEQLLISLTQSMSIDCKIALLESVSRLCQRKRLTEMQWQAFLKILPQINIPALQTPIYLNSGIKTFVDYFMKVCQAGESSEW